MANWGNNKTILDDSTVVTSVEEMKENEAEIYLKRAYFLWDVYERGDEDSVDWRKYAPKGPFPVKNIDIFTAIHLNFLYAIKTSNHDKKYINEHLKFQFTFKLSEINGKRRYLEDAVHGGRDDYWVYKIGCWIWSSVFSIFLIYQGFTKDFMTFLCDSLPYIGLLLWAYPVLRFKRKVRKQTGSTILEALLVIALFIWTKDVLVRIPFLLSFSETALAVVICKIVGIVGVVGLIATIAMFVKIKIIDKDN